MAINPYIKKTFCILAITFISTEIFAQLAPHKYLIKFTDKNNSPYSLSDPSQFLSGKAIERRIKQGIAYANNDLPVTPAYIDSIRNTGVTLICSSKWFNSVTIYTTDSMALIKIHSFPFVQSIDSIARINKIKQKSIIPEKLISAVDLSRKNTLSDEVPVSQKYFTNEYGKSYNQVSMIGLDYLHSHGYYGQNMTIAVIDAGFFHADTMAAFDSLWMNDQILGYKDFVSPGSNIFASDISTHGMMVLSIMGGNLPGKLIGTAPKANYWLLRSEDAPSENIIEEYNWASAAEFADSVGADIINSSLGYTTFDQSWMNHSYHDMDGNTAPATIAADIAASKGIIVCNAAGNSGTQSWHYIGAPADADSILTVGAVDNKDKYVSFSSTGPSFDKRLKPTVSAQGYGTYFASTAGGNNVSSGNGTSFASPVIAGATACLWQANPDAGNMVIIDAISQSANQYENPDSLLGYGIPNFAAANFILAGNPIHNIDNENFANVFPNPFDDVVYILFLSSITKDINIDIFDITGKKLVSKTEIKRDLGYNYFSVDGLSAFSKGLYIIRIYSDNSVYTCKLQKVR
ncbi:MAG TPA: S8/S53 family peptidase [Bacteroidales bacterium]|nr:S8/S53 family peptidase [Bacteroidales bacterium]HPS18298.1 S8/S53 family peptidase [Bacteroidales bacterium]